MGLAVAQVEAIVVAKEVAERAVAVKAEVKAAEGTVAVMAAVATVCESLRHTHSTLDVHSRSATC